MPHDIVVNKDGAVYVGDAGYSDSVTKFSSESKWKLISGYFSSRLINCHVKGTLTQLFSYTIKRLRALNGHPMNKNKLIWSITK